MEEGVEEEEGPAPPTGLSRRARSGSRGPECPRRFCTFKRAGPECIGRLRRESQQAGAGEGWTRGERAWSCPGRAGPGPGAILLGLAQKHILLSDSTSPGAWWPVGRN